MNGRVRGIYTTALTRLLLDADHDVVDASPPIRDRFDESFRNGPIDVELATTEDRQGVGVVGEPSAVDEALDVLEGVGVDTLTWRDPTPEGAVIDGEVIETLGGGAVVDIEGGGGGVNDDGGGGGTHDGGGGEHGEGYLPYGNVDTRVREGAYVRAQVTSPAAPWERRRPELDTTLRAKGGLVRLEPGSGVRVDARDDEAARELAGMTELLGLAAPDGWRIVWQRAAIDAEMRTLETELERAIAVAEELSPVLGGTGRIADPAANEDRHGDGGGDAGDSRPTPIAPKAGAWLWFGRESRFSLDTVRNAVTATMPGHHRIKAGAADASASVDLAEAICAPDPDAPFPFSTVRSVFGPAVGDSLRIDHGKPDGRLFALGTGEVTAVDDDGGVTVRRTMTAGGNYDALDVRRERGDIATTKLKEGRWWYPTTYRGDDGTVKGTYVNVCTPVEVFPDAARYVDLHVDVIKHADGTVERVDDEMLEAAIAAGNVPDDLGAEAKRVASALETALGTGGSDAQ